MELELIAYWTLLVLSALLLGLGAVSLVTTRSKRGVSEKKIVKGAKKARAEGMPSLFAVLEKFGPNTDGSLEAVEDDDAVEDGEEMDAEEDEDMEEQKVSATVEEKTVDPVILSPAPALPLQTCEECGSESLELRPLILAVEGVATITKKVCPDCLKQLTMRHVL